MLKNVCLFPHQIQITYLIDSENLGVGAAVAIVIAEVHHNKTTPKDQIINIKYNHLNNII